VPQAKVTLFARTVAVNVNVQLPGATNHPFIFLPRQIVLLNSFTTRISSKKTDIMNEPIFERYVGPMRTFYTSTAQRVVDLKPHEKNEQ